MIGHLGKLQQMYNSIAEYKFTQKLTETALGYATKGEKLFLTIQELNLAEKIQEDLFEYFTAN